jgi:small subunit ribosomal protein S4
MIPQNFRKVKSCKRTKSYLWDRDNLNLKQKMKTAQRILKSRLGPRTRNKSAESFQRELLKRSRLCSLYGGISKRHLKSNLKQGACNSGSRQIIIRLESRLDMTTYRMHIYPSFRAVHQAIRHAHVYVNFKPLTYPGYLLNPGDIIEIKGPGKFTTQSLEQRTQPHNKSSLFESRKLLSSSYQKRLLESYSSRRKIHRILGLLKKRRPKLEDFHDPKALKPSNLEINYRNLSAIVLWKSQDIFYPCKINI